MEPNLAVPVVHLGGTPFSPAFMETNISYQGVTSFPRPCLGVRVLGICRLPFCPLSFAAARPLHGGNRLWPCAGSRGVQDIRQASGVGRCLNRRFWSSSLSARRPMDRFPAETRELSHLTPQRLKKPAISGQSLNPVTGILNFRIAFYLKDLLPAMAISLPSFFPAMRYKLDRI